MELKHQNDQWGQEESESEQETDDEWQDSDVEESEGKRPRDIFDNDDSNESESTDNVEADGSDDDDNEKPQPETDIMINNVYGEFEEDREEMMEKLIEEGRDEHQAKTEVYQYLVPKYQKAFRHKLTNTLVRLNQLRREPIYKVVMDTAKDLRADGLDQEESIRAAISKRKHKINAYIPDEYESEEEEEEETDDEDEVPTSKRFKNSIWTE